MGYLRRVMHPSWYHGHRRRPPFFEGWYYKLVSATEGQPSDGLGPERYAIIPGIFKSDDPEQNHAFVQVLNGTTGQVAYHRFPAEGFSAAEDRFEVVIGANRFTERYIALQLGGPDQTLHGEVHFEDPKPWPVRFLSPGIMGPLGWIPGNGSLAWECNHGVLSLDHRLHGTFVVDGPVTPRTVIDWEGGRGYIEKDWGAAFPSAWVWMQSNHWAANAPPTSLTASVATIPLPMGVWFRGFIVGLWHGGRLYRFATYTGARLEHLSLDEHSITWVMRDRAHRLEIHATRAEGGPLRGPSTQGMGVRVPETLSAVIETRLLRLRRGKDEVLFEDTGQYAGLEVVGDLGRLVLDGSRSPPGPKGLVESMAKEGRS
jgi:hypothetical protein